MEAKKLQDLKLWDEYKQDKSEERRNVLIVKYMHLVRYNAERIHVKLPDEVQLDDLMSAGVFGLMDAINAFDTGRGVKFETYCAPRIRGAILDELRSMDWVPRLVRSRVHKVEEATRQLEISLDRSPTYEEIAAHMNIPLDEFTKLYRDSKATGTVSLSRKWFETDSNKDVREIDILQDNRVVDVSTTVEKKDLRASLLKGFARAERLIIILYYYEQMTMKEIGVTLDLSESRVSQMHSSVIARLKAQYPDKSAGSELLQFFRENPNQA